jgi:hypothetical protein
LFRYRNFVIYYLSGKACLPQAPVPTEGRAADMRIVGLIKLNKEVVGHAYGPSP